VYATSAPGAEDQLVVFNYAIVSYLAAKRFRSLLANQFREPYRIVEGPLLFAHLQQPNFPLHNIGAVKPRQDLVVFIDIPLDSSEFHLIRKLFLQFQ
jgi:hypothetical protein